MLELDGVLGAAGPTVSIDAAREIAARLFGVTAAGTGGVSALTGERDRLFRVDDEGGSSWLLRVIHPDEDAAVTDLQTTVLEHLVAVDPSLPTPVVRPALVSPPEVLLDDGRTARVRLTSFARGRTLASTGSAALSSASTVAAMGSVLGRIDAALSSLRHPGEDHDLLWNTARFLTDEVRYRALVEPHADLATALDGVRSRLVPQLAGLPHQLIHNDLNPHNVVVDEAGAVVGVIDFGDLVRAPRVQDPAVAMAYLVDADSSLTAALGFWRAYQSENPLGENEIAVLGDLIVARMAMAMAITRYRAARHPDNADYILRNHDATARGLATLTAMDADELTSRFTSPTPELPTPGLLARRRAVLGDAYRLFYDDPVELVRGEGVWLYGAGGERFLDAYNNVACVGHCHPQVVEAIARQAATLNTHTRYLHPLIVEYAERLTALMPASLDTVMMTCTGSEANDLALRLATSYTGGTGVIVTRTAYHGVSAAIAELSPSLGLGVAPHVRTVEPPRPGEEPSTATARFAAEVRQAAADLRAAGHPPAALLVDTILSSDGLVPGPVGFLAVAAQAIRAEGGLFIADEVQAGFGRTGALWGFERHGMDGADAPDLVTLGKPMGNGHPVAGVVLRREIGVPLGAKTRYFNTFGGNPVSCAAAMAVLDVIESQGVVAHSAEVGAGVLARCRAVLAGHEQVVDIRGAGLFIAVEVDTAATASQVVNEMRRRGVLISATGPNGNVLKIRPPLVFAAENGELLMSRLVESFA